MTFNNNNDNHKFSPNSVRVSSDLRKGVTIIELMMAVMILGVVFASSFSLIGMGFIMVERARDMTRVTQILQNEVEDLRTKNWSQIEALEGTAIVSLDSAIIAEYGDRYTVTRTLSDFKDDQMDLAITVVWTDNKGVTHTRTFYTLFTKDGLNDFYYRAI